MAVSNGWSAAASAATAAAVDAVAAARTAAAVAATAAALHAAAASATIIRELNRVGRSRGSGIWSVSSAAIRAASSADTACSVAIAASLEYPVEYRLYAYLSKRPPPLSKRPPTSYAFLL